MLHKVYCDRLFVYKLQQQRIVDTCCAATSVVVVPAAAEKVVNICFEQWF